MDDEATLEEEERRAREAEGEDGASTEVSQNIRVHRARFFFFFHVCVVGVRGCICGVVGMFVCQADNKQPKLFPFFFSRDDQL